MTATSGQNFQKTLFKFVSRKDLLVLETLGFKEGKFYKDSELKAQFTPLAEQLQRDEAAIIKELNDAQGKSVDIKGYYLADEKLAEQVMRPSTLFNEAIASL